MRFGLRQFLIGGKSSPTRITRVRRTGARPCAPSSATFVADCLIILMTMIFVCVGDINRDKNDVLRLLSVLFSDKLRAQDKERILQDDFAIPMQKNLKEGITLATYSEGIEIRAFRKGRAEGREEGREESYTTLIKNLMQNAKVNVTEALAMLGIPKDDWAKYAAKV